MMETVGAVHQSTSLKSGSMFRIKVGTFSPRAPTEHHQMEPFVDMRGGGLISKVQTNKDFSARWLQGQHRREESLVILGKAFSA